MVRYTVFLIAIAASAATAIASLPAQQTMPGAASKNVTELFKNQDWTTAPLILEQCAKADCSDTPAS